MRNTIKSIFYGFVIVVAVSRSSVAQEFELKGTMDMLFLRSPDKSLKCDVAVSYNRGEMVHHGVFRDSLGHGSPCETQSHPRTRG